MGSLLDLANEIGMQPAGPPVATGSNSLLALAQEMGMQPAAAPAVSQPLGFGSGLPGGAARDPGLFEAMGNEFSRGWLQNKQSAQIGAAYGGALGALEGAAATQRAMQAVPTSPEMEEYQASSGWGTLGTLVRHPSIPLQLGSQMASQSLPAMLAGGVAGGALGSAIPGVGTALGSAAGVGAASGFMEATSKLVEFLAESGVDTGDAAALTAAFQNPELMAEARNKAILKAVPIALFDAVSAGLAGRIASKGATTLLGKAISLGKNVAAQTALDAGGEIAGELASGEELSMPNITAEVVGGWPITGVRTAAGYALRRAGAGANGAGGAPEAEGGEPAPTEGAGEIGPEAAPDGAGVPGEAQGATEGAQPGAAVPQGAGDLDPELVAALSRPPEEEFPYEGEAVSANVSANAETEETASGELSSGLGKVVDRVKGRRGAPEFKRSDLEELDRVLSRPPEEGVSDADVLSVVQALEEEADSGSAGAAEARGILDTVATRLGAGDDAGAIGVLRDVANAVEGFPYEGPDAMRTGGATEVLEPEMGQVAEKEALGREVGRSETLEKGTVLKDRFGQRYMVKDTSRAPSFYVLPINENGDVIGSTMMFARNPHLEHYRQLFYQETEAPDAAEGSAVEMGQPMAGETLAVPGGAVGTIGKGPERLARWKRVAAIGQRLAELEKRNQKGAGYKAQMAELEALRGEIWGDLGTEDAWKRRMLKRVEAAVRDPERFMDGDAAAILETLIRDLDVRNPRFDIEILDQVRKVTEDEAWAVGAPQIAGAQAFGEYRPARPATEGQKKAQRAIVRLYREHNATSPVHEWFHALLADAPRRVRGAVALQYTGRSEKDLGPGEYAQAEERAAEQFVDYYFGGRTEGLTAAVRAWFERMAKKLRAFFTGQAQIAGLRPELKQFFADLAEGRMAGYLAQGVAEKRGERAAEAGAKTFRAWLIKNGGLWVTRHKEGRTDPGEYNDVVDLRDGKLGKKDVYRGFRINSGMKFDVFAEKLADTELGYLFEGLDGQERAEKALELLPDLMHRGWGHLLPKNADRLAIEEEEARDEAYWDEQAALAEEEMAGEEYEGEGDGEEPEARRASGPDEDDADALPFQTEPRGRALRKMKRAEREVRYQTARAKGLDKRYLAAVERGDLGMAQRMVDAAAKKAGYNVGPVWHGTSGEFTVFKDTGDYRPTGKTGEPKGYYFTELEGTSEAYAWNARMYRGGNAKTRIIAAHLSIVNPRRVSNLEDFYSLDSDDLQRQGHDGIIRTNEDGDQVEIAVFSPSQIKSAEAVTRDDSGRVIPLSERFNEAKDDIRFQTYEQAQEQAEKVVARKKAAERATDLFGGAFASPELKRIQPKSVFAQGDLFGGERAREEGERQEEPGQMDLVEEAGKAADDPHTQYAINLHLRRIKRLEKQEEAMAAQAPQAFEPYWSLTLREAKEQKRRAIQERAQKAEQRGSIPYVEFVKDIGGGRGEYIAVDTHNRILSVSSRSLKNNKTINRRKDDYALVGDLVVNIPRHTTPRWETYVQVFSGIDVGTHKAWVKNAVEDGKPVPRRVLKEYENEEWARRSLASRRAYEGDSANAPTAGETLAVPEKGAVKPGGGDMVGAVRGEKPVAGSQVSDRRPEGAGGDLFGTRFQVSAEQDKKYLDAVQRGDIDTAQKMAEAAAKKAGYVFDRDYHMAHQAPNRGDSNLLTIRGEGLVPDDYWTRPDWYQSTPEENESFFKVKAALDRADKRKRDGLLNLGGLMVYRAVPKTVKESNMRNGDWVTPSRSYAVIEGLSIPGGYRILSVPASLKHLWWDGNSIAELGYDDGKGYVYKNTKNNRKLIAAVTYDDQGEVIPLSKRFNPRNDDIRFQVEAEHGSPHDFDRFTTAAIGTGEGAQAFGWGLYFTSLIKIAKYYAENLTRGNYVLIDGQEPTDLQTKLNLNRVVEKNKGDMVKVAADFRAAERGLADELQYLSVPPGRKQSSRYEYEVAKREDKRDSMRRFAQLAEAAESGRLTLVEPKRNLYKVTLHKGKQPGEYNWLDWNKPTDQQEEGTKRALRKLAIPVDPVIPSIERARDLFFGSTMFAPFDGLGDKETSEAKAIIERNDEKGWEAFYLKHRVRLLEHYFGEFLPFGEQIYYSFVDNSGIPHGYVSQNGMKDASLKLLAAGIDGIRYPVGSLGGGKSEGTNYVVFDENAVTIEEHVRYQIRPETRGKVEAATREAFGWVADFLDREGKLPKDRNARPEISRLDTMLRTMAHYSKKVPALRRLYESAQRLRDNKHLYGEEIFGEGEGKLAVVRKFAEGRKTRAEWEKLNAYIDQRGVDQDGYRVRREGEAFVLVDPAGNDVRAYRDEEDAWRAAHDQEARDLTKAGFSKEAAAVLREYRGIADRMYHQLNAEAEALAQEMQALGKEMPTTEDGTDLFAALSKMGDLRGSYMPRVRLSGQYQGVAYKDGKRELKVFATATARRAWAVTLRRAGWKVDFSINTTPSEEAFLDAQLVAVNDLLLNALDQMERVGEDTSLETFDLKGQWVDLKTEKGETERHFVIRGEIKQRAWNQIFKDFGGRFYDDKKTGTGEVWHFKDAPKAIQNQIVKALTMHQYGKAMPTEAFARAFVKQISNLIHARGSRSHKIGRVEGTGDDVWRGYEPDARRALNIAGKSVAGGTAKRVMAKEMMKILTGTDVEWADFRADWAERNPDADLEDADTARKAWSAYVAQVEERRIDSATQPNAYKEGVAFSREMLRNEEPAERVFGVVKGVAALKYLSGIAPGLVNLTAMATTVPAAMKALGGIPLRHAARLVGKAGWLYGKHYIHERWGKGSGVSADDQWLFRQIASRGWDDAQLNMEAVQGLQNITQRGFSKAVDLALIVFSTTERINRGTTIAAAYWGLREQKMGKEAALTKAKEISDAAHGVYSKADQPAWLRGSSGGALIGRSFYTYKKFSHNYAQVLLEMGLAHEWKSVGWMLASPALLAGAGASVAVQPVSWMVQGIMMALPGMEPPDDPEEEFYRWLEETFGGTVARAGRTGALGLAGVNIKGSLSIGIGDLPTDWESLLGAPYSLAQDALYGLGDLAQGNTLKGMEKLAPRFAASKMRAYREATEGATTHSNQPIYYGDERLRANWYEALLRALAFNPAGLSEKTEKQWKERKAAAQYSEARAEVYAQARRWALGERSKGEWLDVLTEAERYNARVRKSGFRDALSFITPAALKGQVTRVGTAPKNERIRAGEAPREDPGALTFDPGEAEAEKETARRRPTAMERLRARRAARKERAGKAVNRASA